MTYRDTSEALRAERDQLLREIEDARHDRSQVQAKLARAENALVAYRRGVRHPDLAADITPRVVFVLCAIVYASSVLAAMQDHDELALHLAFASVVFSLFAPLAAWSSSRRILNGAIAWVAKVVFSFFAVFNITSRQPRANEAFLLFWWAPAIVLFCAALELGWLWALTRQPADENG